MYDFFKTEDLELWEEELQEHLRKISFEEKTLKLENQCSILEDNIRNFMINYGLKLNIISKIINNESVEILVQVDDDNGANNGYIVYDDSIKKYKFILGEHFIEKGLQVSEPMILEELDNWISGLLNELSK